MIFRHSLPLVRFYIIEWHHKNNRRLVLWSPSLSMRDHPYSLYGWPLMETKKTNEIRYWCASYLHDKLTNDNGKMTLFKGEHSGLRHFMATESPSKMMKNAFYFTLKALFVLEIYKFLFWHLSHAGKLLDRKTKVNIKIYSVTNWIANNCNTRIAWYLKT